MGKRSKKQQVKLVLHFGPNGEREFVPTNTAKLKKVDDRLLKKVNAIQGVFGGTAEECSSEEQNENGVEEKKRKTVDGIMPDDGYDYSIHFREPGDGLFIPASNGDSYIRFVDRQVQEVFECLDLEDKAVVSTKRITKIITKNEREVDNEILEILENEEGVEIAEGGLDLDDHLEHDLWDEYMKQMNS